MNDISNIILAVFASTGFWAFVTQVYLKKSDRKSVQNQLMIGIAHNMIMSQGTKYIEQGYITKDQYEDFYEYLWKPYKNMGGNGTGERIMKEVEKLPLRKVEYKK